MSGATKRFGAALVLWLVIAPLAGAQTYFDPAVLPPTLLSPPPAPASDIWKQDIDTILALQQHADPAALKEAAAERHLTPEMVAEAVPALTRSAYPALYRLLERAEATSRGVVKQAKNYWNTKRPYLMDSRVKALIDAHDNPAYPSGHTAGSFVLAYVLSLALPQKRQVFLLQAEKIAQHRVLVGMHYPHDVKAGKEMALLILGSMMQSAEFQRDVNAAKQELQQSALP